MKRFYRRCLYSLVCSFCLFLLIGCSKFQGIGRGKEISLPKLTEKKGLLPVNDLFLAETIALAQQTPGLGEVHKISENQENTFLTETRFKIPQFISVKAGQVQDQGVFRFTTKTIEEGDITCIYKSGGASYEFKECTYTATGKPFQLQDNTFSAITLSSSLEMELEVVDTHVPGASGICGKVFSKTVTLTEDIYCNDDLRAAITLKGDGTKILGEGFKFIASRSSIGVIVLGKNNTLEKIWIGGEGQGIAVLSYHAENLSVLNSRIEKRWVGIDIIGDAAPTLTNVDLIDLTLLPTRQRLEFGL